MTPRDELLALLDELEIEGTVRAEMLGEPSAALMVLRRAKSARGIRSRPAFAIWRWRHRPAIELVEPFHDGPPSLEVLEQAWSKRPSIVGGLILKLIAVGLERHGGFDAMRADFERRRGG